VTAHEVENAMMQRKTARRPAILAGGAALALIALAGVLAPARASADALLLKDGTSFEGQIKDKGTEWEVVTSHGSVWVDKSKVKKQLASVDQILEKALAEQKRARGLFEEAKKIQANEPHNAKLREALKVLEGVRDILVEAQEAYTSRDHYVRLSELFKKVIQEMRIYRDQFQVGGSAAATGWVTPKVSPTPGTEQTTPGTPSPGTSPGAIASNPGSGSTPGPSSTTGAAGTPGSAAPPVVVAPPPDPAAELEALAKAVKALIEKGEADEAYTKYVDLKREGGNTSLLRPELARAFYHRGIRQKPPVLTDLRRAFDLDSNVLEYREALSQAAYEKGVACTKQGLWNEATQEFAQSARVASELLFTSKKAKYHNWRGLAYHWRGIAETQKFKGKGGHSQLWWGYRQAKADYEAVLRLEPDGPYAAEARDNLNEVNKVLSVLSKMR
jgi:tetratricopeptide (TPR) repeat protein